MVSRLGWLMSTKFLIGFISGYFVVALPLYLREIGISVGDIGWLFGISMLVYAFLIFTIGVESDVSGRLRPGVIAICVMGSASVLFGFLPWLPMVAGFGLFIVSRILFSLGEAVTRNLTKIRILDISEGNGLGNMFGIYSVAVGVGSGLGILAGAFLLTNLNLQVIFFFMPVVAIAAAVSYAKAGDAKHPNQSAKTRVRALRLSNLTSTSRVFRLVLFFNTVILFAAFIVDFLGLPLYQREVLGMQNSVILLLLGVAWTLSGLVSYVGGKAYDRFGYGALIVSLFFVSVTSVLLANVRSAVLFSVVLIADYLLSGFEDPARFALAGRFSMENKGMLMSFFELFAVVTGGLVLLFFGPIIASFGFASIFYLRAAIHLGSIILIIYLMRLEKVSVSGV